MPKCRPVSERVGCRTATPSPSTDWLAGADQIAPKVTPDPRTLTFQSRHWCRGGLHVTPYRVELHSGQGVPARCTWVVEIGDLGGMFAPAIGSASVDVDEV